MREFGDEDARLKQAMARETSTVPAIVRERMERLYGSLTEYDRERRRHIRRQRNLRGAGAGLLAALIVAAGFASPSASEWLHRLPVIGSSFSSAGDPAHKEADPSGFDRQTVVDQGIALTLDRVVYDGALLTVRFVHEPGIRIEPRPEMIAIDGKPWNTGMGGRSERIDESSEATIFTFNSIDSLPDSFEMTVYVNDVVDDRGGERKKILGNWAFQAKITEWRRNVREVIYSPPLKASADGIEVSVTGVLVSPLTTKVSYELVWPERDAEEDFAPKDRNDPSAGEKTLRKDLVFRLFDDRGTELEPLSASGMRASGGPTKYSAVYANLRGDSSKLRLSVDERSELLTSDGKGGAAYSTPVQSRTLPLTSPLPLTVELGGATVTFRKIDFGADRTIVDYEVKGDYPYEGINWWVEDADQSLKYSSGPDNAVRLGSDGYSFRMELPALPDPSKLNLRILRSAPNRFPIPGLDLVLPLTE